MTAVPRGKPYIWVTWLANVMSGNTSCQWQYWFQAHNVLKERHQASFDSVAWQIGHTRLLTEVKQELFDKGIRPHTEVSVSFRVPEHAANIAGKIDCLVEDGPDVMLYDCKTGKPRDSHRVQLMTYMYGLSTYPRYASSTIRGTVVYRDSRVEIPYLPEEFASDLTYFVGLLTRDAPLVKEPGFDCEFCRVSAFDCPDRQGPD